MSTLDYIFPVKREYERCAKLLQQSGILNLLDGNQKYLPSLEQVCSLLYSHRELVTIKAAQGFNKLLLTPLAIPIPALAGLLETQLSLKAHSGNIYRSKLDPKSPGVPVKISAGKKIWFWDTLRQAIDGNQLIYFPRHYGDQPWGWSKTEVISHPGICAFRGWSIGLIEEGPFTARQDKAKTLAGRKQLETGLSPREYMDLLQQQPYCQETGFTLEDFFIRFLTRLLKQDEISYDRYDHNSLWLLGHYIPYLSSVKSGLVPTGWWHRVYGRLRLDAHRPGNRQCTSSWGTSTVVRLPAA